MKHRGTGKRKGGPKGHDHDALVIDGPPAAARPPPRCRTRQDKTSGSTENKTVILYYNRQM